MEGFAGYYGQTAIHPLAVSGVLFLAVAALLLPRRLALWPLLAGAALFPMAQRVVIAGADFTLLRILLLAYLLRVVFRAEWREIRWTRMDTALLVWVTSGIVVMSLDRGASEVLFNRLGWGYDILLTYFVVRSVVQAWSDLIALAKGAVVLSAISALFFLVELNSQYNVFSIFGGVPEITRVVEGRLRCQGPFAHPILAGGFWAALLPVIWMLMKGGFGERVFALVGSAAVLTIVVASSSSTSVIGVAAAVLGAALYRFRERRTLIWSSALIIGLILHFFVMKQPIWHLIARIDIFAGSTGWHRFVLIDVFVQNFSDWYLTGYATPTDWHWYFRDITNQYILEALRGGLLTLLAFGWVLVLAFSGVGRALAMGRAGREDGSHAQDWILWLVGVTIFVHVVSFLGISYFAQISALLYFQLGIAGSVYAGLGLSVSTAPRDMRPSTVKTWRPELAAGFTGVRRR